ncbi:MAG: sec-independent protein translocase protein TatB [Lysobacterales bacterium]|jgi:sec-independent protein translocase protein TatB
MFDVGFAEIFLLALIGLIVLGPEKLPAVARTLGGFVRKARTSWYSLRRSIEAELAEADLTQPIRKVASDLQEAGKSLDKTIKDAADMEMIPESSDQEIKALKESRVPEDD